MIPSDHFVRFYNEVFKFLDRRGPEAVEDYYREVSSHQNLHCLETFKRDGFQGMFDYWDRIRIEENCRMRPEVREDCFYSFMELCPSLSKVTDNDAGAWPGYCEHCPGWVLPLMTRAGFYGVYNMIDRAKPQCEFYVYQDRDKAAAKYEELKAQYGKDLIRTNLEA